MSFLQYAPAPESRSIVDIAGSQPQLSVAVSVLSLGLTWVLLLLISALDRRRAAKETP